MFELNDKIKDLNPYVPNGAELDIYLDANESFIELSDKILSEIAQKIKVIEYNRYPDPSAKRLCKAFADVYNLDSRFVTAGNGSDELISVIFNGFLQKEDKFATLSSDFSMYNFYGYISEGRHVEIKKENDLAINTQSIIETCNAENVKLLIFSNPCNPTSLILEKKEVREIVEKVNALVVLDEAYMEFADESLLSEIESYDNLIILKTFSKAIGAAAIRLGFAVSSEKITNAIKAVKSPYNVNTLTQEVGEIILKHSDFLKYARDEIVASKKYLEKELQIFSNKNGFKLLESSTNFFSLIIDNPQDFVKFLAKKKIAVRYTAGLVRITCGSFDENDKLIDAMKSYFKEV